MRNHGKLTNFLLKVHILEEGSYREDIKRRKEIRKDVAIRLRKEPGEYWTL